MNKPLSTHTEDSQLVLQMVEVLVNGGHGGVRPGFRIELVFLPRHVNGGAAGTVESREILVVGAARGIDVRVVGDQVDGLLFNAKGRQVGAPHLLEAGDHGFVVGGVTLAVPESLRRGGAFPDGIVRLVDRVINQPGGCLVATGRQVLPVA